MRNSRPHNPSFYSVMLVVMLQVLGSCSTGTSATTQPYRPKTIQFLVCTANVYRFQRPSAANLVKALETLRQSEDDVVVFGFQETSSSHQQQYFQKGLPQFQVFHDSGACSNTLAVFTKKHPRTQCTVIKLPRQHPATPDRYALLLDLPDWGIKIANTHLVGGRYDDQHWMHCTDGREQQLATLLQHRPAIVMGDFNADSLFEQLPAQYWQRLLQKATSKTLDDLIQVQYWRSQVSI